MSPEKKWVVWANDFKEIQLLQTGIEPQHSSNTNNKKREHIFTEVARFGFTIDDLYFVYYPVTSSLQALHLHPGLYAAAKFTMFCVLAKNRKVKDFSCSLVIFSQFFASLMTYCVSKAGKLADFTKFAIIAKNCKFYQFSLSITFFFTFSHYL